MSPDALPSGADTDPAVVKWIERDLAARTQILVSITDSQVLYVANCTTAAQMWQALTTIRQPSHIHLGQYSIGTLWHMRASEETNITEHLTELTHTIRQTLLQNGQIISDTEFKNILLESLPPSWEPCVSSLTAQATTVKLTVDQLCTALSEQYQQQKQQDESSDSGLTASLSSAPTQKKPCAICGCTNHITAQCHWRGKKNIPKCDICGKISHTADKCWKNLLNRGKGRVNKERKERDDKGKKGPALNSNKGKGKEKARENIAKQNLSSDEGLEKSFSAFVNISDANEMSKTNEADFSAYSWIIDSGATAHICAQLDDNARNLVEP